MAEKIDRKELIRHDTALEVSYGSHIPQPRMVKGDFVAIGELADSTDTAPSLSPARITFGDSIVDNRNNQPRSH